MAGGKREGAGRPKGSVNKVSEELRRRVVEMGADPAEFLANIILNESLDMHTRKDAAVTLMPYCYRKQATMVTGSDDPDDNELVIRVVRHTKDGD